MVKTLPWFDQYLAHLDLELLHHAFLIGGNEGVGKIRKPWSEKEGVGKI